MPLTVQIRGFKEAQVALQQLESKLRNQYMREAISAAMAPIKAQARATTPEDTGLLRGSLRIKAKVPASSFNPNHRSKPAYGLMGPGRGIVGFQSVTKSGRSGVISARTIAAAEKATKGGKGFVQFVRERDRHSMFRPLKIYQRRASRYAHFIEKGRKGKGATHWLSNAADAAGSAAQAAFAAKITAGMKTVVDNLHAKQKIGSLHA